MFSKKNLLLGVKICFCAMLMMLTTSVAIASVASDFSFPNPLGTVMVSGGSTDNLALEVDIPDGVNNSGIEDVFIYDGANASWSGSTLFSFLSFNQYFMDNDYDTAYTAGEAIVTSADGLLDPTDTVELKGTADLEFFSGAEFVFDDTTLNDNDFNPGEAIWSDADGNTLVTGGDFAMRPGLSSVVNLNSGGPPTIMFEDAGACPTSSANSAFDLGEPIWDDIGLFPGIYDPLDVILYDPIGCLLGIPGVPGFAFAGVPTPYPGAGASNVAFLDWNHDGLYTYFPNPAPGAGSGEPLVLIDPGFNGTTVVDGGALSGVFNPGGSEIVLHAYNASGGGDLGIGATYIFDWTDMSTTGTGTYMFVGTSAAGDPYNGWEPIIDNNVVTDGLLDPGEVIDAELAGPSTMVQAWGTVYYTGGGSFTNVKDIYNSANGIVDKAADELYAITFRNNGTMPQNNIAALNVWMDGGDNAFDAGGVDDVLLGTAGWDGMDGWELGGLTQAVAAGGEKIFVSVDIIAAPLGGVTVDLFIQFLSEIGPANGLFGPNEEGVFMASTNDGPKDVLIAPATTNRLMTAGSSSGGGGGGGGAGDCGDGVLDSDESCDDGNRTAGDGCSVYCSLEEGYVWDADSETVMTEEEAAAAAEEPAPAEEPTPEAVTEEPLPADDLAAIAANFSDFDETHWAAEYIAKLYLAGIMTGYGDSDEFGVSTGTTRAEIVKIALLANSIEVPDNVTEPPFPDTPLNEWYTKYVAKAVELEIVEGYEDGNFKPGNIVNRGEALKILFLAKGIDLTDYDLSSALAFSDVSESLWYAVYVAYAVDNGIIEGYDDGTFKGGNDILRAEMAKITVLTMLLEMAA
ncbi:S-layer homology domain-containing protein [Patescibacteria group bacterium]